MDTNEVEMAVGSVITQEMIDNVMIQHVELGRLRSQVPAANVPAVDALIANVVALKRMMGITTKPILPA